MSTIKVDTYLTRGGASEIAIDKLKGVSSASSISVVAEGGTNTTNLQQGLIKAWNRLDGDAGTLATNDSFGISGIVDVGVARYTSTFTNAMGNAHYSISVTGDIGASGRFMGITKATSDTSKVNTVIFAHDASFADSDPTMLQVAGDLA